MGISVDYCLAVPDAIGDGEVCAAIQDNPVQIGGRDCFYGETDELYSVDASLLSENLGPLSFSFGFWIGIEMNGPEVCLWLGSEDLEVCVNECTTPDRVETVEFITNVTEDFVDEVADEINNTVVTNAASIIVAVIVFIVLAIIGSLTGGTAG